MAALIFGGGGLLSIHFFSEILTSTQGFVDQTLPKINTARRLDVTARNIDQRIQRLITSHDRQRLNAAFTTTNDLLDSLEVLTVQLSQEEAYAKILSLNRTSQAIRSQAQLVFQVSTQRLLLLDEIDLMVSQARQELRDLAQLSDSRTAHDLPLIIVQMLAQIDFAQRSENPEDIDRYSAIYQSNLANIMRVNDAGGADQESAEQISALRLSGYRKLFLMRNEQLGLEQSIAGFKQALEQEVVLLSGLSSDYSRRIFDRFQKQAEEVLAQEKQAIGLTVLLMVIAVLALFLVHWLLVVRGFGDRLALISDAMERVPSEPAHTLVPVSGKDEIAHMARSLEGFLRQALTLRQLASEDELTGLYNRRYFLERVAVEAAKAKRKASPACVLMLDIDHFKSVNDSYGHSVGDQALIQVAEICRASIRPMDTLARFGGEEFALLLPDTRLESGEAVGERIREAVQALRMPLAGEEPLQLTLSLGLAEVDLATCSIDDALQQCDSALYQAKALGRNRLVCWS